MKNSPFALQHPVLFWGFILAVVAGLGVLFFFGKKRSEERRRVEEEQERIREEERQKLVESEIGTGKRLADGRLACIVCQMAPATLSLPDVGLSVLERLNPLRTLYGAVRLYRRAGKRSWLRTLFSPDRSGPLVCAVDHDILCSLIDEELAACRRATAAFGANIDRRIARIRGGALIPLARQEAESRTVPLQPLEAAFVPLSQPPPRLVETTGDGVDPESESAQASR